MDRLGVSSDGMVYRDVTGSIPALRTFCIILLLISFPAHTFLRENILAKATVQKNAHVISNVRSQLLRTIRELFK